MLHDHRLASFPPAVMVLTARAWWSGKLRGLLPPASWVGLSVTGEEPIVFYVAEVHISAAHLSEMQELAASPKYSGFEVVQSPLDTLLAERELKVVTSWSSD